jgi:hypothetical protein
VNQQSGQYGFATERVGPNKPSFIGLLQPMADAVKLFIKKKTHQTLFLQRPRQDNRLQKCNTKAL